MIPSTTHETGISVVFLLNILLSLLIGVVINAPQQGTSFALVLLIFYGITMSTDGKPPAVLTIDHSTNL